MVLMRRVVCMAALAAARLARDPRRSARCVNFYGPFEQRRQLRRREPVHQASTGEPCDASAPRLAPLRSVEDVVANRTRATEPPKFLSRYGAALPDGSRWVEIPKTGSWGFKAGLGRWLEREYPYAVRRVARPAAPPVITHDLCPGEISPSTCHVSNSESHALTLLTFPSPSPPAEHSVSAPKARGNLQVVAGVTKKPDLSDPVLRAKLAKGMGHNYYGEPAWPNDLLYIFPVVILGTIALCTGLAVMEPTMLGEPADPFATPLEILPEWYFFPTFNALRVIPNKLLGVLSMAAVPVGLITVPFLESINKFQNPFRRPVATSVFLIGTFYAIWMGIGATMPIDKAITLGVF